MIVDLKHINIKGKPGKVKWLKRRKKSDTYLTTIRRHHWSRQITMKIDKILDLSASNVASSAEEEDCSLHQRCLRTAAR